jgi:hypothetical protein
MSNERIDYLKEYFNNEKVKVEVPVQMTQTSKGMVLHIFSGERLGYRFRNGFSMVLKKDLHLFRENYPHFIIHDDEEGEE